ncbi:unnamed protein product [Parajaminaea phylloscopi]
MSNNAPSSTEDILLYFLALFVPPAPVIIKRGCGGAAVLNVILCFLCWFPGVFHALWTVSKYRTTYPAPYDPAYGPPHNQYGPPQNQYAPPQNQYAPPQNQKAPGGRY